MGWLEEWTDMATLPLLYQDPEIFASGTFLAPARTRDPRAMAALPEMLTPSSLCYQRGTFQAGNVRQTGGRWAKSRFLEGRACEIPGQTGDGWHAATKFGRQLQRSHSCTYMRSRSRRSSPVFVGRRGGWALPPLAAQPPLIGASACSPPGSGSRDTGWRTLR